MRSPAVAMFADPVEERALKADVVAESFGFQPFVAQDLFPFGEKFLIKRRFFNEIARRSWLFGEDGDMETTVVRKG